MDNVIEYRLSICMVIILTTVFFPNSVHSQGTPVLTITPNPITVGETPQNTELKCQIDRVEGFITRSHKVQRRQLDLSYTTIATISFSEPTSSVVNDVGYSGRSDYAWSDPSGQPTWTGSLQIRDVYCTDAAAYRCQTDVLSVSSGQASSYNSSDVELETIKLPSESPTLSYSPPEPVAGQEIQFACSGNVGRPAKQLSIVSRVSSSIAETLPIIGNEDLSPAGDDCTQIRRIAASRTFVRPEAKLGVVVSCNVEGDSSLVHQEALDIKYPVGDVEITIDNNKNEEISRAKNTRITIRCSSTGDPIGEHKIYFIKTGQNAVTEWKQNSHVIGTVSESHAGMYFCTASNTLSTGNFSESSQNITLTVTEPPPTTAAPTTPERTTKPSTAKTGGSTGDDTDDNTGMIVGIVVGVLLALIIIAIIIFCVYKRRSGKKQYLDEPSEKPRNNQDMRQVTHAPDLVTNGSNKPSPPPPYDNPGFDRGQQNLHYADLTFDDKPRSRRPVALSDINASPYAEVNLPRV